MEVNWELLHLVLFVVMAVYVPVFWVLFWRLRRYQPIRSSQALPTLVAMMFLTIGMLLLTFSRSHTYTLPFFVMILGAGVLPGVGFDIYLLIAVQLYVAFSQTETILMMQRGDEIAFIEGDPSQLRRLRIKRWLSSQKMIFTVLCFTTFFSSSSAIIYGLVAFPESVLTPLGQPCPDPAACNRVTSISRSLIQFRILCLLIVSWRLHIVKDILGIKKRLKRCAFIYATGTISAMLFKDISGHQFFLALMVGNGLFIVEMVYPVFVVLNKQRKSGKIDLNGNTGGSTGIATIYFTTKDRQLRDFLRNHDGLRLFKKHMIKEFAVESVMFLVTLDRFRQDYVHNGAADNVQRSALQIYQDYVDEDGLMCLNLSYKTRTRIRSKFKAHIEDPSAVIDLEESALFDSVETEIVHLLASDSLRRFLQDEANAKAWEDFIAADTQLQVIATIGGTTTAGANTGTTTTGLYKTLQ